MRHAGITIIVVAFVLLAALYSVVVPLGEGPDEPGHVAYVFFLARERRLPVQQAERARSDVPGEGHQPPLAYALAAPLAAWLPAEQRAIDQPGNPRFIWSGGSEPNAVAHGSREFWPWSGAVLAWHLARLVSVACGAATVVLTYLAARALDFRFWILDFGSGQRRSKIRNPKSKIGLLAAALVAFNPQFLFVSALVTNDALLAALSAAVLWLAVRQPTTDDRRPAIEAAGRGARGLGLGGGKTSQSPISNPQSPRERIDGQRVVHAALMGLLLGLALLTKQSALILAPVAALSVLERSIATGRTRSGEARSFTLSLRHLVTMSVFVATALLVCGWWYLRNLRLYGDPFGLAVFQAEFTTQAFDPGRLDAWSAGLKQLHSSFWARFGWMNVWPPGWAIWFFTAVELVALIGLALGAVGTLKRWNVGTFQRFNVLTLTWWPILALPLLSFAWVVSFALTAGLVAWQGRLVFPALPAIAILLATGIENAKLKMQKRLNRASHIAFYILHFALLALAIWLPFGAIRPAYTIHTLPEQVALERLGTPIYGRLARPGDPGAELRGWRLDGSARPGETLDLALIWHARGRQDRNWTVFVHLVDAQEHIVAEDNREPRDGAFPAKQWVAGDWIEDRHPLALPADLAPGTYELRVGLWYPRTGRRAAVYDEKNKLIGDYLEVTRITVSNGS